MSAMLRMSKAIAFRDIDNTQTPFYHPVTGVNRDRELFGLSGYRKATH
jgi:hypothetical protein